MVFVFFEDHQMAITVTQVRNDIKFEVPGAFSFYLSS